MRLIQCIHYLIIHVTTVKEFNTLTVLGVYPTHIQCLNYECTLTRNAIVACCIFHAVKY